MRKALRLAILWHMHQPSYLDPETGRYLMPWTRLHAIRDYYDMALYVEQNPGVKVTFNYVPSLWEQIFDQRDGKRIDEHEFISRKDSEILSDEERIFVAREFFHCHDQSMINPYPRFRQLRQRYKLNEKEILAAPSQDIRDICVWFNLAWCGRSMMEEPEIIDLFRKGENFSEEDKLFLLDRIRQRLADILPLHKKLQDEGRIEVCTTPYYHPILPLLIDVNSAHKALPNLDLPKESFSLAEDADVHIKRAIEHYENLFGRKPRGFWPSEGSLSPATAELLAENGIEWAATDEDVLWRSLGSSRRDITKLFRPYSYGKLKLFFRDHGLSDKIGFNYGNMTAEEAVRDFIYNLHAIKAHLPDDADYVVPVILDGENCWEYYEDFGAPFLNLLYKTLAEDSEIETVTFEELARENKDTSPLPVLHSGSWIYADFTTWIGDKVKNRAWKQLFRARKAAQQAIDDNLIAEKDLPLLWESIYSAEGSDWFWWFGEGHSSDQDEMFDLLFRKLLLNIYKIIGAKPPRRLSAPLDTNGKTKTRFSLPTGTISPKIDGQRGNYWKWHGAGECLPQGGSMQKSSNDISRIKYGMDEGNFYLFLESPKVESPSTNGTVFSLVFESPMQLTIELPVTKDARSCIQKTDEMIWAHARYLEVAIPLDGNKTPLRSSEGIKFHLAVFEKGIEIERLPEDGNVVLSVPDENSFVSNWVV